MVRREFLGAGALAGAALLGSCRQSQETASATAKAPSGKPVKMHAGTQHWAPTPENLQFIKRHGVDHIAAWPRNTKEERWLRSSHVLVSCARGNSMSLHLLCWVLLRGAGLIEEPLDRAGRKKRGE